MCVSGVRSRVVSCECVCVSCEWASRRSSVVRREAFFFALCFVRDSEVFVSCFEFDSRIRFLEFSKSYFEVEFRIRICRRNFRRSIRLLEFRCSILFLEFQFSIRISIRILNSSFSFRRSIRLLEIDRRIRLLEFHCSSRFLEFRVFDSSALNFEFVLIYSTSRIVVESVVDLFDFSNIDSKVSLI